LTVGSDLHQRVLDALVAVVATVSGVGPIQEVVVEAPANVLLFIPIGFLLCWGFPRFPALSVWSLCVLASVGIEFAQGAFLPDRTASLVDVVTNALGAGIGVLAYVLWVRRGISRDDSSTR
jgi:glycopeptide antibiotics resistance protein